MIVPTGIYTFLSSLAPGSVDPHTLQKYVCQSWPGFDQYRICPCPAIHLNFSEATIDTAIPPLPVDLLQMEQWQINTSDTLPSASYDTAPQLHSPFNMQYLHYCLTPQSRARRVHCFVSDCACMHERHTMHALLHYLCM